MRLKMTDPTIQRLCRLIAQAPRAHSADEARLLIKRRKKQIGNTDEKIIARKQNDSK